MRKPLTAKQRADLAAQLKPVITDVLSDPTMQAHILNAYGHAPAPEGPSYTELALAGSRGQQRQPRSGRDLSPGLRTVARVALATVIGNNDRGAMLDAAKTLDVHDELQKALSAGSSVGGGALLREDVADEVVEALRGASIVRQAGPRGIEIPAGNMRVPRIDVSTSSGWIGEGQAIPVSDLKTGSVNLVAKTNATIVALTNELSRFAQQADIDQIVVQDMVEAIAETEDRAFLEGSGTQNEPLGILNAVDAGQKFNSTGSTVDAVVADLSKAMTLLLNADVPMRDPVWLMAPRTRTFLQTLTGANDQFLFRDELSDRSGGGRLFGWPVFSSTHIPVDLGAGNDESRIYFIDIQELMIGDVAGLVIDRSGDATLNIDGVDVSLFQTNRAAFRVLRWVDSALRHSVSASVIEAVKWGA